MHVNWLMCKITNPYSLFGPSRYVIGLMCEIQKIPEYEWHVSDLICDNDIYYYYSVSAATTTTITGGVIYWQSSSDVCMREKINIFNVYTFRRWYCRSPAKNENPDSHTHTLPIQWYKLCDGIGSVWVSREIMIVIK